MGAESKVGKKKNTKAIILYNRYYSVVYKRNQYGENFYVFLFVCVCVMLFENAKKCYVSGCRSSDAPLKKDTVKKICSCFATFYSVQFSLRVNSHGRQCNGSVTTK